MESMPFDRVAVIIRCGGDEGRCDRQLGVLKVSEEPGGKHLLENQGWPLENGYPLIQAAVPADFSGATGILMCPGHTVARSSDGDWRDGDDVQMPLHMLRGAYNRFIASGKPQEIYWLNS
jgi:hypothetical protein